MPTSTSCTLDETRSQLTAIDPELRGFAGIRTTSTLCLMSLTEPAASAPHYGCEALQQILRMGADAFADVPGEALLFEALGSEVAVLVWSPRLAGLACSAEAEAHLASFPSIDGMVPFRASPQGFRASVAECAAAASSAGCLLAANRGVLVWGATTSEVLSRLRGLSQGLEHFYEDCGSTPLKIPALDGEVVQRLAPRLRGLMGTERHRAMVVGAGSSRFPGGGLLPEHLPIADVCFADEASLATDIEQFHKETGVCPRITALMGRGVFFAGSSLREARELRRVFHDALQIERYAEAFGGASYLPPDEYQALRSVGQCGTCDGCCGTSAQPRLHSKACLVTGGAQGFGLGIARALAEEGATLLIADLNEEGAQAAADTLNGEFGPDTAVAIGVNIADEESVRAMTEAVVAATGGLDMLVANAGVLKAASVKEFDKRDWDLVTDVNYTGYFLCTKHCAPVMARQCEDRAGPWMDIVQINSKSGLEGSNRNAAYAGSKFGTIGLTQSFAKELVDDRIKVNSVCPGNFFDGPLWSDPEKGLFVQYLNTGKVPGAKTIEEVKKAYESKVPMGRGCTPKDVARAILYLTEQEYETGQAVPVTGGQVMLK